MSTENEPAAQPDEPTAGARDAEGRPPAPAAPPTSPPAARPTAPRPAAPSASGHPAPPPHATQAFTPQRPPAAPAGAHGDVPTTALSAVGAPYGPHPARPHDPTAPGGPAGPVAPPPFGPPPPPGAEHQSPPPPDATWGAFPPPPPPKRRRGLLIGVIVATLIAGGVGGGVGYLVADDDSDGTTQTSSSQHDDTPARPPDSVAGIAQAALPSVVTIDATGAQGGTTGTGFVFDEQGHILTNNHVVASADQGAQLTVTFSDGQSYDAEVVGRAEGYDVAVIRLTDLGGRELTPLPIGDSDQVAVGDATVAIGAPFGLSGTVTTGIISAKDRPVASSDPEGGSASYMNALQTDASINPGNSGGPLLNADGEVIGVNSAIRSTSSGLDGEAGSIGLGFAIPINQAKRVAGDLIDSGEAVYPIIGATVGQGDGQTQGAQIVDAATGGGEAITPGGPADEAGLEPGDVITKFGDRLIDSGPTLISQIWTYEPGDTVDVTYLRDGQEHTTTITLGQRVGEQQ
ncbi:S1C family serine protease [Streptomyces hoynatensis]|uniref:PDZ domain-containing protein n=1 Tax=Streptomyces hoynatensis TaxID=1141874 RepID=A0A3A9YRX5_9ACTN|nr:trypsin-like peptidase domain-containing protein [Streptomyces hoynatensis]RKN37996.1 PDZ domain-containing protein [Streptomyces hoynatensis]